MPPSNEVAPPFREGGVGVDANKGGASSAAAATTWLIAAEAEAEAAATVVWMVKSRREAAHRESGRAGLELWCSSGGFG